MEVKKGRRKDKWMAGWVEEGEQEGDRKRVGGYGEGMDRGYPFRQAQELRSDLLSDGSESRHAHGMQHHLSQHEEKTPKLYHETAQPLPQVAATKQQGLSEAHSAGFFRGAKVETAEARPTEGSSLFAQVLESGPDSPPPTVTGGVVFSGQPIIESSHKDLASFDLRKEKFQHSEVSHSKTSVGAPEPVLTESDRGDVPPPFLVQHILSTMQKSKDRMRDCTRLFLSLQSKTILWLLIENLDAELSDDNMMRREQQKKLLQHYHSKQPPQNEMERRAQILLDCLYDRIEKDPGFFFHASPAGDMPLHVFFLLRVSDLCRDVIQHVYVGKRWAPTHSDCINIPFKSNLRWLAADDGVQLSSFKRMTTLRDHVGSLRQFVGFDQSLREWQRKGWTAEGRGADDLGLYTGLTVLHIAIANQSIGDVEVLLRHAGADVRARATGAFFQPGLLTPFKDGRRDKFSAIRTQMVYTWLVNGRTLLQNEKSGFYAGELPLSFAASVGNLEILRILLDHVTVEAEKMRLIAAADSFGNTALHMAVYHNRKEAFDWLMAHGARKCLTTLNVMGLTPFTTAAYVGNGALMLHILRVHMVRPLWEFGEMRSVEIEMAQLDSFRIVKLEDSTMSAAAAGVEPGSLAPKYREWSYGTHNTLPSFESSRSDAGSLEEVAKMHASKCWRSAVEIIIEHQVDNLTSEENPEIAQLVKGIVDEKWRRFAGGRHLRRRVIPFMVLVLFFSFVFLWRCSVHHQDRAVEDGFPAADWTESRRRIVWGMEAAMVAVSVPWLLWSGVRYLKLQLSSLDVNMDGDYATEEIIIFLYKNMQAGGDFAAVTCIFICSMCRIAGADQVELAFYTFLVVVLWANVMSLLIPSPTFGSLTFMIYHMLVGDIFKFLIIYGLLLLGFGLALFGLLQKGDFPRDVADQSDLDCVGCDIYFGNLVLKLVYVSMGEVEQSSLLEHMELPALGTGLYVLYSVLSLLLLLNLIIAMMGDTYHKAVLRTERDWFWPYACLVLQYERESTAASRQRHRLGLSSESETEQGQQTYAPFFYYRETTTVGDEEPHLLL